MQDVTQGRLRLVLVDQFGLTPGTHLSVDGGMDDVLSTVDLRLDGTVADRFDTRRRNSLRVQCPLDSLKGFDPSVCVAGVESAEPWLEARRTLQAMASDASATDVVTALPAVLLEDGFAEKLSPAPGGDGGGHLDSLLSKVDLGGGPQSDALAEVERRLQRQAVALAQSPWLVEIERAWRGADLLQRQLADLPHVQLELLSSPQAECAEQFFQVLFHREYDAESETPLAAMVLGYGFDRGLPSLEALQSFARMGESLRVPCLANLSAAFWGIKRQALLAGLPDLAGRLQGPEYVKWNALRDDDVSLWLALAANRVLLRDSWRREGVSDLPWEPAERDDPSLWGGGALAVAVALARSHVHSGLHLNLVSEVLSDLPRREDGGSTEVHLNEQRVIELGQCGMIPLVSQRGAPEVHFPLVPTFHRPRRYDQDAATRASVYAATLPHQVFAALASHQLQRIAEDLELGLSDDALAESFRSQLMAFLGVEAAHEESQTGPNEAAREAEDGGATGGEEAVTVEIETPPERPETRVVTVRLLPPFDVCGGRADLVLGTAVLVASA